MGKLIWIVLCLPLYCHAHAADFYVSHAGAGAKDGTLNNAWERWASIDWDTDGAGADTGVGAGDTLYIIGTMREITLTIGGYGTGNDARLVVTSDLSTPGKLWHGYEVSDSDWTGPDEFGAYYKTVTRPIQYDYASEWTSDPWAATELTRALKVPDGEWTPLTGLWYHDHANNKGYYKPTAGTPTGKTLTTLSGSNLAIELASLPYVTISNLVISNPIRITNGDYDTIDNNEIYCSGGKTQNAIAIGAPPGSLNSDYVTISNNELHHCGNGIYTINQVSGDEFNNNYYTFSGNYIHDISGTSDSHCIGIQGGNGGTIEDNTLYGCGSGITMWNQTTQTMQNNTIRRNSISHMGYNTADGPSARGIEFSGETADSNLTTGNLIYGNVISDIPYFDAWTNGVGIRIKNGIPTTGYSISAYNNTVSNCHFSFYILPTNYESLEVGAMLKNNISLNPEVGGYHIYVSSEGTTFDIVSDYNVFYPDTAGGDNTFYYDGTTSTNFSDWKVDSGLDANSSVVDPLLVSASDFHLQGKSTLKNLGINLGTGYTDFAGVSLPSAYGWPIGGYAYNSFGGSSGSFRGNIQ